MDTPSIKTYPRYVHPNGDYIEVVGEGKFNIVRNGVVEFRDVSRWTSRTEQWIQNDINEGFYEGFVREPRV